MPTSPPEPSIDLTGRTLGDYQLLRKLGQGAMGQVYLARQLSLKRDVALKILRKDHSENPTALKRFQAEAEAVARLSHPNIVQVYAVGEQDGIRFMALEYVDGRNLREYLSRKGSPELSVALLILKQVAAALQKAGEVGLVHRDIKPENIMITRKIEVKVADFGLSRTDATEALALNLTQSGMTLGTPLYMSPEQVQGKPVDPRSDLYSFGITAFQLLAGQTPFTGATAFDVALQHVQAQPPQLETLRPDLPRDLCELVHKLLAKNPNDRYGTAREVIRELTKIQKGLPLQFVPPSVRASQSLSVPNAPSNSVVNASGSRTTLLPVPSERRSFRWMPALALPVVGFAGWWAFGSWNPLPDPVVLVGLPEARTPSPLQSSRERELTAKLKDRTLDPSVVFDFGLELGVLYLDERRFDDAEKLFKSLVPDRAVPAVKLQLQTIAKLGEAMTLTYRDRTKEAADLFNTALDPRGQAILQRQLEGFLIAHPDFGEALAAALTHLAESVAPDKLPSYVDYLRSPGGFLRGPK